MTDSNHRVVANYYAQHGRAGEVVESLRELAVASRQEPANLSYELFAGLEDDHHIVILETYVDANGFAAHRTSEHFERIGRGRILPLLIHRTIDEYSAEGQCQK
jgi:quinol monooxygenase YgiN